MIKSLMNYLKASKLNLIFNEPLKSYTTFGIGGCADVLTRPKNTAELSSLIRVLKKARENFFILGCGSNLLINDEGFKGIVISLRQEEFLHIDGVVEHLIVGAGTRISTLLGFCKKNGFSGLEFMAGIPASVGGAIRRNAGTDKRAMAEVIKDITYLDEKGKLRTLPAKDLNFSYHYLDLELSAITRATLKLKRSSQEKVEKNIRFFFDLKKQKQPLEKKSAGCIFKNPEFMKAGLLIEEVGLKGRHCGGACISEKHGNFIINEDNATYNDILYLIDLVRKEIKLKKDILLETEVNIL